MTSGVTIPPRTRKEWEDLVLGKIEHRFQNFVLQIKSAEYQRKIKGNKISKEQAADELFTLCEKYALAVQPDLKTIFTSW